MKMNHKRRDSEISKSKPATGFSYPTAGLGPTRIRNRPGLETGGQFWTFWPLLVDFLIKELCVSTFGNKPLKCH